MPIGVTFAHPLSRRITPDRCWRSSGAPRLSAAEIKSRNTWGLITLDRLDVQPSGLRIGPTVYSEVGPMGLDGILTEKCISWRPGEFLTKEEEVNYRLPLALCLAGVRKLALPLQDADLAATALGLVMGHKIKAFRELRSAHPEEINVVKEQLPIEVNDIKSTAKQLRRIAQQLKKATFPHRYGGEQFDQAVRTTIKELNTNLLALLLIYSAPLGIWQLCYFGNTREVGPNAIARELLSRPDASRPAILVALANSSDPEIIQTAYRRLGPYLTWEETALFTAFTFKYCQDHVRHHFSHEYLTTKIAPALEVLSQMVDQPILLDRGTLIEFSRSDFGLDTNYQELGKMRDFFCLKAFEQVFPSLSAAEILSYFSHKSSAILSVRLRLFEHPLMPEAFCRKILFEGKDPNENDVGAYRRLRPILTSDEVNALALKRKNSPELRAAIVTDPALSRENRLVLMSGSSINRWDNVTEKCGPVLVNGVHFLWDTLTPEELRQLFPTGFAEVDLELVEHPNFSSGDRLAILMRDIPLTRTYCDIARCSQEVVLALLTRAEKDFSAKEFQDLYAFLTGTEWQVDFNLVERILCNSSHQPDLAAITNALFRQAAQVDFREKRLENIDLETAGKFGFNWVGEGAWQVLMVRLYDVEFEIYFHQEDTVKIKRIMEHPKFVDRQREISAELGKRVLMSVFSRSQFAQHIREKAAERGETVDFKLLSSPARQLPSASQLPKDGK